MSELLYCLPSFGGEAANTWGIYLIGLVCDWLKEQGGIDAMQKRNKEKAALLAAILTKDGTDQWMRLAVMSSLGTAAPGMWLASM